MNEKRTLKIPAALDELDSVSRFVEASLQEESCPVKKITSFLIALDELCSNIVTHSNASSICVRVSESEHAWMVEIEDDGSLFNPLKQPSPDISAPLNERAPGGLGIYMARKLMDEVTYTDQNRHNCTSLIMYRNH